MIWKIMQWLCNICYQIRVLGLFLNLSVTSLLINYLFLNIKYVNTLKEANTKLVNKELHNKIPVLVFFAN